MIGRHFDVIVVGIGAMGSAACYHLAHRGARVLGLEQFDIPHDLGSSHGMSRIIRKAYYEHPDYVPLLRRAYELWHQIERASGQKLLHVTGAVYMGRPDGQLVAGSLDAARRHGLPHELLTHAQVNARFPQFRLPRDHVALFEPEAGYLLPERVICAYARAAMEAGAQLHGRKSVREWSADSSGVCVKTDAAEYRAEKLVFCAGPWSAKLLEDLGVKLVVTRQVMLWFWPREQTRFGLGRLPVWGIERAGGGIYYGFPMSDEDVGLKVAIHAPGVETDPNRVARDAQPGDVEEVRRALGTYLPDAGADAPLLSLRVCLYTNSPDSHFIIDRHPRFPQRVSLACGFSGHGFKFASVVGEILTDLALVGAAPPAARFLALNRFGSNTSAPTLVQ
jgi:sarcosine oxidase